MASSVFLSTNEEMCGTDTQSNLVVVYGKNGITVDRNGLESLMDEKNVSSISVVRLTSPTPSMKDEKNEDQDDMEHNDLELISNLEFTTKHDGEDSAELVGLTVEEFYPPEEAKKLAKEILNYAGVINPLDIAIDYEFQKFVIQNDHCYTPLTSPSQGKSKNSTSLADTKNVHTSVRQYGNNKPKKGNDSLEDEEKIDKNDRELEDEEEYTDYSESTGTDDTDNDRDSDLDFNVNDRGRRPRKTSLKKTRKVLPKINKKRNSLTDKEYSSTGHSSSLDEERRNSLSRSRGPSVDSRKSLNITNSAVVTKAFTKIASITKPLPSLPPPQITTLSTAATTTTTLTSLRRQDLSDTEKAELQLQSLEQNNRVRTFISTSDTKLQPPKTYIIKKDKKPVIQQNTGGGGFTDINTLIGQNIIKQPVKIQEIRIQQHPTPVVDSFTRIIQQQPTQSKGFMPLGVESAVKNQLPAQISIQTHPSSSNITAEHDKQLDLIDSIVKDEMEKSNIIIKNTMNENIPQIVKMLENTEKAILNKSNAMDITRLTTSTSSSAFTNSVEDIDIANAPLLDSAEDELTEDLLQHVAELIEQKNFQEVMENQAKQTITTTSDTLPQTSQLFIDGLQQPTELMSLTSISSNVAEKQMPTIAVKKEPIQIVRGDGRVITLPPIEAPTTRAKRRAAAQSQVVTATTSGIQKNPTTIKSESSGSRRGSMEQKATVRKRASISSQNTTKEEDLESSVSGSSDSEDDPDRLWCICRQPHNNRFMICCDKCEDWFHGTCVNITKAMGLEMEQNGIEWTCPKCLKDGDFQSKKQIQKKITAIFEKKPLEEPKKPIVFKKVPSGLIMKKADQKKTPDVRNKSIDSITQKKITDVMKRVTEPPKKQPTEIPQTKIIEMISPIEHRNKQENTPRSSPAQSPQQQQQQQQPMAVTSSGEDSSMLNCIVCKKSARPNSIYCSDDCIRRHAQNALISATKVASKNNVTGSSMFPLVAPGDEKKKKIPSSFEEALAKASETTFLTKNKIERVYVYERKTGRLLTGNNAPTTGNLKKWLQENPTFEVVLPGSPQALAIEKSKKLKSNTPETMSPTTTPTITTTAATASTTIVKKPPDLIKLIKPQTIESNRSSTPKLQKYPQQVSIKPGNSSEIKSHNIMKMIKKQISTEQKAPQPHTPTNETEPIRLNVKRTLKEQLISRMKEYKTIDCIKLTNDEIEQFASNTEYEMFKLFNKDTGAKYKAKYRSLMFNIKDRKNQTLFQKICEKKIEPKQLVRMSPEELASQELAQWRQNENKHQLEMIKKSELDLLSCAKNYVLKTHKGEEVIESKSTDRVSLDITIPVEDVVTVLNNSAVSSTSEMLNDIISPNKDIQKLIHHSSFDTYNDLDLSNSSSAKDSKTSISLPVNIERKKSKNKDRNRDRHHRSKDKHKSRKRSRSHSRSRSKDRRHKSPIIRGDELQITNRDKEREIKKEKHEKYLTKTLIKSKPKENKSQHNKIIKLSEQNTQQDYNLIDKILESTKTVEEAANLIVTDKDKNLSKDKNPINIKQQNENSFGVDSDQEPSSTVVIATPPKDQYQKYSSDIGAIVWRGSINMIDVATFQIVIQICSGKSNDLKKELPLELDVVGRISPETVWDYISKIKKSPNKEIVIIRLVPSTETENVAYTALYTYLDKRKRLGVVKTISPNMKDFYILPLAATKSLPSVLQPHDNSDFFNDDTRPDLLMGIIIRIMGKRSSTTQLPHHIPSKNPRKTIEQTQISNISSATDEERFTPPQSPKSGGAGGGKKGEIKSIISASRLPPKSNDPIDIDSILTTSTNITNPSSYIADDADEPYSPGGSSDEELNNVPMSSTSTAAVDPMTDELKRKMDEINRQIEAQKIEIAGMLNIDQSNKTYSPSQSPSDFSPTLASISIPSNLQQILASIKPAETTTSSSSSSSTASLQLVPPPPPPLIGSLVTMNEDEEYVPVPTSGIFKTNHVPYGQTKLADITLPMEENVTSTQTNAISTAGIVTTALTTPPPVTTQSTSRLAQLTEAELLSLVPDKYNEEINKQNSNDSTQHDNDKSNSSSAGSIQTAKKPRWDSEPPPPGLEDEFM